MNIGLSFQNGLYGLEISRLRELYFQAPQLLVSTAILIRPSRLGRCIYRWKVIVTVYVNAPILGYRLKKDATSSQNMGHFGLGLVTPGRFGLILGVGRFSRKGELFRPWMVSALDRLGPISIGRIIWCKDRLGLWYTWQVRYVKKRLDTPR